MPAKLPESACCRDCDYLLRGLPSNVCPECGRDFDLDDPRSYAVMPRRRRFRRRTFRITVAAAALAILVAVVPRGLYRGEVTIKCKTCGAQRSITRWEAAAPDWTGLRYPAWAFSGDERANCQMKGTTSSESDFDTHDDDAVFRSDQPGNSHNLTYRIGADPLAVINGLYVNVENAAAILEQLMNPHRSPIFVWFGSRRIDSTLSVQVTDP